MVYVGESVYRWMRGQDAYLENRFERAAEAAAQVKLGIRRRPGPLPALAGRRRFAALTAVGKSRALSKFSQYFSPSLDLNFNTNRYFVRVRAGRAQAF